MPDRRRSLDQLQPAQPFDVLVVGGGATGLGIAVDAAHRGYRTALIERNDFSAGTSSRSTKLVHGGVRYLKQGNIALVREALRERGRLAANAPHLVSEREFVIPSFSRRDQWLYGAGLKLYDLLAGELGFTPSRRIGRDDALRALPTLRGENLVGGVAYSDGQFDDARLAVTLALTAQDQGAVLINHCACIGLHKAQGRVAGVRARDNETGDEFVIPARVVLNATGVFVDELRRMDEGPAAAPLLVVSQGIHLVLPRRFLPGESALMAPKTADGRVLFAVPWHDHVVVGTTDSAVPAPVAEPRALVAEREFVMEHARRYLSEPLHDADVQSIFAGLRPLVKAGARRSAALSREHTLLVSDSGLLTITGGKWTTYRRMAEDAVNEAARVAGLPERACGTETLPLFAWTHAEPAQSNLGVYGSEAPQLVRLLASDPEFAAPLHARLPYRRGEIVWHVRHEMARTVEDVLARRTRALLLDATAASEAAPLVATLIARELRRDETWIREQVRAFQQLARGYTFTSPESTHMIAAA